MTDPLRGHVGTGFEGVAESLARALPQLLPGGAALSVRVHGEAVVDLWCGEARPGRLWQEDTLAVLASSTKGVATMAAQICADRGWLDVHAPVAELWPEFAAAGKERVTVAQVLSHSVGLTTIPGYTEFMWPDGRGWDQWDEITARLAGATPAWEPGTRVAYHGFSWGWLAGEIVQRAACVPITEFVAKEIAQPLGIELRMGRAGDVRDRLAHIIMPPGATADQPELLAQEARLRDPEDPLGAMMLGNGGSNLAFELEAFINDGPGIDLVLPSSTAVATAAGLADAYAAVLDGRLVSADTMTLFATEYAAGPDVISGQPLRYGLGYLLSSDIGVRFGPNRGFGHTGFGGQIGWADPESGVAFALLRSRVGADDVWSQLADAVYASVP